MSEDRQTLPSGAIDQSTRSGQAEQHADEPRIESEEDVVETSRRRIAELEDADRLKEERLIAERKRTSEAETRAAEAERKARDAETRATQATSTSQQTADQARLGELTTALAARKDQIASLEAQLESAFTAGEGAKLAKLQTQIGTVAAQIVQLEQGEISLKQRIEIAKQQPAPQPQQTVEEYRQSFLRTQPTRVQEWLRTNWERYWSDSDFQGRVAAAAQYADKVERIPIDSSEYIDYVNDKLGLTHRQESPRRDSPRQDNSGGQGRSPDGGAGASDPSRRMVAAPAGGAAPGTSSNTRGGGDAVYLTRDEKSMAVSLGLTEAEYAANKRQLLNEGLIGPNARNR